LLGLIVSNMSLIITIVIGIAVSPFHSSDEGNGHHLRCRSLKIVQTLISEVVIIIAVFLQIFENIRIQIFMLLYRHLLNNITSEVTFSTGL
jgi:hypothetical protein